MAKRMIKRVSKSKPKAAPKKVGPAPVPGQNKKPRARREASANAVLRDVAYAGPSAPLNTKPSKVPIDFTVFGTRPDRAMTERTEAVLNSLKAKYGKRPFPRGNLDTGVLKTLGAMGVIEHVEGGPSDPDTTFRITG